MIIKQVNVDSLIIYFGDSIDCQISNKVKNFYYNLKEFKTNLIIDIIPSYTSIFVVYDIFKCDYNTLESIIKNNITTNNLYSIEQKIINIDVYYNEEVGLDLKNMSLKLNLNIEQIIKIHSNTVYDVYAIGFMPGFAFLGKVDEKIQFPRLSSPRKIVPKGSVAIADFQTAVYPEQTPGGWNIIGKTNFEFFDKSLDSLSPINIGDKIKFSPITKKDFLSKGGIL